LVYYFNNSNCIKWVYLFDKTGTFTIPDKNKLEFVGNPLLENEIQAVVSIARQSVHPLSKAIAISVKFLPVVAVILIPISSISVVGFATFSTRFLAKRFF
jgi:hypothetical protein